MASTVRQIYELRGVKKSGHYPKEEGRLTGLEIEVEGVPDPFDHLKMWHFTQDGSLRYNGAEYISDPLPLSACRDALGVLYDALPEDRSFSMRTSTHVHVNVQDLTMDQVWATTLLYSLLEPFLYDFVGRNRKNNIFCVPLNATGMVRGWAQASNGWSRQISWSKYLGYNMEPLGNLGTLEFRHMTGTNDLDRLTTWINMCHTIVEMGAKMGMEGVYALLMGITSREDWWAFVTTIFPGAQRLKCDRSEIDRAILCSKARIVREPKLPVLSAEKVFEFVNNFGGSL